MPRLILLIVLLGLSNSLLAQRKDSVIIKSIYFGGGSYEIDSEQILEIYRLVESIPNIDEYQISITSHTDNIGGKRYNEWLSKMRSEAVIEQLVFKKNSQGKNIQKGFWTK